MQLCLHSIQNGHTPVSADIDFFTYELLYLYVGQTFTVLHLNSAMLLFLQTLFLEYSHYSLAMFLETLASFHVAFPVFSDIGQDSLSCFVRQWLLFIPITYVGY